MISTTPAPRRSERPLLRAAPTAASLGPGSARAGPTTDRSRFLPGDLRRLANRLASLWDGETAWIHDWDPRNAARGQCGTTSLVVQDQLGGRLMRGLVHEGPGTCTVHYWNRIENARVDLTWQQFGAGATIVATDAVERADLLTNRWFTTRYETLGRRLDSAAVQR